MSFYHLNTVGEICFYVLVSILSQSLLYIILFWWHSILLSDVLFDEGKIWLKSSVLISYRFFVCLSVQWLRVTLKRSLRSAQPCMYILGKGFVAFISILVGVHNFNLYFKVVKFFNDRRSSKENSLTTPWSRDLSEKRKFSSNYSTCLTMKLNWCQKTWIGIENETHTLYHEIDKSTLLVQTREKFSGFEMRSTVNMRISKSEIKLNYSHCFVRESTSMLL